MQITETDGWQAIMVRGNVDRIKPAMGRHAQFAHDQTVAARNQALAEQPKNRSKKKK